MAILGYVRTWSDEESQVFDRHSEALTAVGCERVFGDRLSGSADERPGLTTCLAALRWGDVLVVLQLDHLGYRMEALIRFVSDLTDRGVGFRALDTVFDTTTPAGRAFLQIQSALAEMERTLIRQRISGGVAAARARGRKGGRPRLMTPERLHHAQRLMADPSRSIPSICHELNGLPVSTLYHYLRADGALKEPGHKLLERGNAPQRQHLRGSGLRPLGSNPRQRASNEAASELAGLRQQVEALDEAVRARDDFIAIAAHELRNPMTPLSGLTELALAAARTAEDTCPPRVTALLERLQQAVQEFIGRATRLLDVSRMEAGNLQLEPRPIDLSQIVLATVHKYEVAAAHQRCDLEPDISGGIGGLLDPLAVEQVVENLLSNALKFGAAKPVAVRLCSDGWEAQLDVWDHGIGMSPEQQARIFGRFEQVVAHHRGSGFGVGLWVANRLVSAMGGRITVSSRPGEGSTFRVTLPLLSPPSADRTLHE